MSIDEAKRLYPTKKDWQFQPLGGIAVGDRVNWLDYYKEKHEGTVIYFCQWAGQKPVQPDWKVDADFTSARIQMDDGSMAWKAFWSISKIKSTPETATGGEGDKQQQNGSN